jgi:hypothetical protein
MSQKRFSQAYVQHLTEGPFPNRIDMWAEEAYYFHQIHATMISSLIRQMREDLLIRGYVAGREASLQIVAKREPDIYVEETREYEKPPRQPYAMIAAELEVNAGLTVMDEELELDAIRIYEGDSGRLVTVIEIVSPSNKASFTRIEHYREQRSRLFLAQGINVVEIDPIRSVQHLIQTQSLQSFAYHIAVFLPEEGLRLLGSKLDEPLQPFALPLREDAIRVETQDAYDDAYRTMTIASQIQNKKHYIIDALPFLSTLTDAQKETALQAIEAWQAQLEKLREDSP